MLNITAGTDITLAVTLRRDGKLFPVELSDSVKVNMVSQRGVRVSVSCRVGTGKVAVPLLGEDFSVGVYGVEVTGKLNGANWRTFGAKVVKYTYETQRGAARVIANGDTYDIELEVGQMSDIVPHSLSELDSDPEHRTVTDEEKERWNQGGGKINIVKVDGEPLDIDPTDKSVNIDLSGKVDKEEGKGLSTNDYTDAEKQSLNAAIEQAERVNATLDTETNIVTITDKEGVSNSIDLTNKTNASLSGSVVTITDREGNESEIDLLNATNERVYINVTAEDPERIVSGIVVNCFLNNDVDEPLQATTNENGQCYFDVPNNYRYRLVFPTRTGCDPITDVTHIAHASERIVDVVYKEHVPQPEVGEALTVVAQKVIRQVASKMEGLEVAISYGGTSRTYTTNAIGEVAATIPYGTEYTVTMPVIDGLYLAGGKFVYKFVAESTRRSVAITYRDYLSGMFVVCSDGGEYSITKFEELREAGKVQNSDAKLVKVFTDQLANVIDPVTGERKSGVFGIDIDFVRTTDLSNIAYKKRYSTQNKIFNSIPENGNNISKPYYFDGYTASELLAAESVDLDYSAEAAVYCVGKSLEIGDGNGGTILCRGFLGSLGQWNQLQMNIGEIDEILLSVRPKEDYPPNTILYLLSSWEETRKWTSTQTSRSTASSWSDTEHPTHNKDSAAAIIPFYTL